MGNPNRKENIVLARKLLCSTDYKKDTEPVPDNWVDLMILIAGYDPGECPECNTGHMVLVRRTFKGVCKRE